MNEIIGRLYSIEKSKNRFDFSEEGIFLGCEHSRTSYNPQYQDEKENFERFREMLSQNGSWRSVKGKHFSVYPIPLIGSDEFLLHSISFERENSN